MISPYVSAQPGAVTKQHSSPQFFNNQDVDLMGMYWAVLQCDGGVSEGAGAMPAPQPAREEPQLRGEPHRQPAGG